ncbi:MAG: hypothetical protein M9894_09955 [Planctomycetes bacterium]|nr:hypothetical protein [Planctomycetota bacterium]
MLPRLRPPGAALRRVRARPRPRGGRRPARRGDARGPGPRRARRGDAAAAAALVRPDAAPLLRAEVARALGRRAEHAAALEPLLAAGDPAPGWSAGAASSTRAGRAPRARRPRARAAAPSDAEVVDGALLLEGAARAAAGEPPAALEALARRGGAPLALRLEARRLLALAGATFDPPDAPDDPSAPVVRALARLRLARAAPAVAAALGRVALHRDGLYDALDLGDAGLDLAALEADARRLGEPDALAAVAALRLARDDAAGAAALARLAGDGPAAAAVLRLCGEEAPAAPASPPTAALLEGRAWLGGHDAARAAAFARRGDAEAARVLEQVVARARAALDLAVHLDPFAAGPLSARATLRLSLAAVDGDEDLRAAALRDAAAALALDPRDGAARWVLLAAVAAVDPEDALERAARPGPALTPGQARALGRSVYLDDLADLGWTSPADPDDQAALREAALLLGLVRREPAARREAVRVADALRRRLHEGPTAGLEVDLLQATLVLEDPTELEAWLLHRRWTAGEGELARALDGPRGAAARVALILQALTRLPPGAAPEALAEARARALSLLEGVARARPGPAVQALRAAIEVWTGAPDLEVRDLLAHPWPGALSEVLRAAAREAGPGAGPLWEHAAVRRLLAR